MTFQKWGGNAKPATQAAIQPIELPQELPQDFPIAEEIEYTQVVNTPTQGFPDETLVAPDNMQLVDKGMLADILKQLNDLKADRGGAVDLSALKKMKRVIRVAFYQTEEGVDYIVTGLEDRLERDGSKRTTWEKGRDEFTDKIITWIRPIMVEIDTGIKRAFDIRYDEFSSSVRVAPMEVDREVSEQIDMTPKACEWEEVEQATYQEKGGYYRRQGTGIMVKLQAWGIKTIFTVTYEGKQYDIDQTVINYK